MEKKEYVSTQLLYECKDSETNNRFNLSIIFSTKFSDTGITTNNPNFIFGIVDNRIGKFSKAKIALGFSDFSNLCCELDFIFNNSSDDIKKLLSEGVEFKTTKFYKNNKKELIFSLNFNNKIPKCIIEIVDPSVANQKNNIKLSYTEIKSFWNLCVSLRKGYPNILTNMMLISSNERNYDLLKEILIESKNNKINNNNVQYKSSIIPDEGGVHIISETSSGYINPEKNISLDELEKSIFVPSADIETDNFIEESESNIEEFNDVENDDSNLGKIFAEEFSRSEGFKDILIEKPVLKKEYSPIIKNEISTDQPFLGRFLHNKLSELNNWVTAFLNVSNRSESSMFSPLDVILKKSIPNSEYELLKKSDGYYAIQAYFVDILKSGTRDCLKNGDYPNVPIPKFNITLTKDTPNLWEMIKEIIVLGSSYMIFLNDIRKVGFTGWSTEKQNLFFIRKIMFSLAHSSTISVSDIDEIMQSYKKILNSNIIDDLKLIYSELAVGGTFDIDYKRMEKFIKSVFKAIDASELITSNEIKEKYNRDIEDYEDVKDIIVKELYKEEPKVKKIVKTEEEVLKQPEQKVKPVDLGFKVKPLDTSGDVDDVEVALFGRRYDE